MNFSQLQNTTIDVLTRTSTQLDSGQVTNTWATSLTGIKARRDIAPKGYFIKDDKYKSVKESYVFYVDNAYKGVITANNRISCETVEYFIDDIISFDGTSTMHHIEIYAHKIDLGTTAGVDIHSQALTEVIHDNTLTGKGTVDEPLSVNGGTGGAVDSVNSQTGTVVLDADDIAETATRKYVTDAEKATWNGKADLVAGKVPASQLPAFVDDVLEYANLAGFPVTGESDKVYIAIDTNKTYRWSGSMYVEIGGGGVALGETSSTAYRGDRGKIAYDHSQDTSTNPHNVTKSQVGLGNVDNTSDANKPISTATQTALDGKVNNTATQDFDMATFAIILNELRSTSNLQISATLGNIVVDSMQIVLRATSGDVGVSSDGGSHIAYFNTDDLTGDPTFTFPDTNGKLLISVNNVIADNLGNVSLDSYSIPHDSIEANVGDMLVNLYDNKNSKLSDFSGAENTLFREMIENNSAWMFPTEGATTYNNTFRIRGPVTLSGVSATSDGTSALLYTTTTTPANVAQQRATSLVVNREFTLIKRFEIITSTSDTRFFHGTSSQYLLSAITNVEPDTLLQSIGVGKLSTSNNLHVIHNDGSGTATVSDLGVNYPANSNLYEYTTITKKTLTGFEMWIRRKTKSDGSTIIAYYSATTDIPSTSQSTFHYITNNASATAVQLKDYGPYAPIRII